LKIQEYEKMRAEREKTNNMVMTAMMMGLIMAITIIIRIPVPATHGYIHLGDCMIFMAVLLLGWKRGAVAAGLGSALADIIGGFAIYAPVTFVVKFMMAAVVGLFLSKALKKEHPVVVITLMEIVGMLIGGAVMTAGYYVAEGVMYGNFIAPMAEVPMNIIQFGVGAVLAAILSRALAGTPVGRSFAYDIRGQK
jgi:uncharacterized membrane protein